MNDLFVCAIHVARPARRMAHSRRAMRLQDSADRQVEDREECQSPPARRCGEYETRFKSDAYNHHRDPKPATLGDLSAADVAELGFA